MEVSSQLTDSIYQLWSSFVSGDGFTLFSNGSLFSLLEDYGGKA